jgi:hypothetical protein
VTDYHHEYNVCVADDGSMKMLLKEKECGGLKRRDARHVDLKEWDQDICSTFWIDKYNPRRWNRKATKGQHISKVHAEEETGEGST